jgi:hypothetical protein
MARGERTEHSPRRKVGADSGPWSNWANRLPQNASAVNEYEPHLPHTLWVGQEPSGKYAASYEHHAPGYGRGDTEVTDYEVETRFKDPERAKLAAEALSNRVNSRGGTRNYMRQTYHPHERDDPRI